MPLESLFGGPQKRAIKKSSRRLKQATSPRGAVRRNFETLEDRSLLTANYLAINPTGAADPTSVAALGGQVLFAANDGSTGTELWKSDGTASGTVLVKDINPGSTTVGGVSTPNSSNPTDLVAVGGFVYFAANDGADGVQLWKSDGTTAGTTMVTSANVAGGGMNPADLTAFNGYLFFTANDGADGNQVWATDGTTAGTIMISNLKPSTGSANPSQLTAAGGTLYFTANTGSNGVQLYRADGIPADTQLVFNVNNGAIGASPTSLTNVNGTLFYAGYDSTHGNQLWKSDGTVSGTAMVTAIGSGTSSSNPTDLTAVDGTVYFAANDGTHGVQLYKSDGTAAGTTMVTDINTTSAGASANPTNLTDVDGVLYFRANDGVHGAQLWRSDGTVAGTSIVVALNSGSVGATPANLVSANGFLFFTANDGVHGFELWQSDGTAGGTTMLADINPGAPSSNPMYLTAAGNNLFASANDGTHGISLYSSAIPAPRPTVVNSSYIFTPGEALVVGTPGVLTGATASPGTTLTAVLVSPPSQGALTLNSDGSFTYTPNVGFRGKDTFTINASNGSSTSDRAATVTIESLDYRWVANLYTDVLGRSAGATSDAEINYWVGQLAAGASRLQIASVFVRSNEYFVRLVQNDFQQVLQRDADPLSLSYFVGQLEGGTTSDAVLAEIISSSEFQALSGTTNGFVSNLYNTLLGRLPTGTEFGYWVGQLSGGVSPSDVADLFVVSTEFREIAINSLYMQYLHRSADIGAIEFWLGQLSQGQTFAAMESTLASSNEFYNS